MDDADRADERVQNIIDGGIAIASDKAKKIRALVPIRECYYCGGALNDGFVFCPDDGLPSEGCQADYYHMLRREKENGL